MDKIPRSLFGSVTRCLPHVGDTRGYWLNLFMEIVLIAAPFDRVVDLFYT
jgi:hypothetical protein